MADATALFWDIGGVILTNGWDRTARQEAARKFALDGGEMENRHELAFPAWETGQITLDDYMDRTVFYVPRSFAREDFRGFIFAQSRELPDARAILDRLARSRRYFLGAINNEARELNGYRIERFDLRRDFAAFFSSCYAGIRKPDEGIYKLALDVTQRKPEECLFIDDRPLNVECARKLGMRTIVYTDAAELRAELEQNGIVLDGN